ncbi:hypothetical protein Poli38472_005308 [Pythium oligandrum]|uniref:Protein phosphatase 1 regulatory subunit 7 n=1 Tax=Pythium oligandrum TaxID=41045 RepID=A0A8K1CH95_PYTOL|nr:hypothetical protein Poli38472_005308 [Pythium oligandrum]|eukprot:TMW62690.1 hypothetical protein Poli38472_005308 [Pythium oligandrum]
MDTMEKTTTELSMETTEPAKKVTRVATADGVYVAAEGGAGFAQETQHAQDEHDHDHDHEHDHDEDKEAPVVKLTECVEFTAADEDIYYVGTAGIKATQLDGLEDMPNLTRLHVRSNLLQSMEGLGRLPRLEHLEFYDNQIGRIECIDSLVNLRVLDLSFNGIRSIPDLSHLTQLEELYVANNKLTKISGIAELRTLRKLDLGANRLRTIEGLDHLENLEQLWLGKNKITEIKGLEALRKLKIISVQSNRLLTIEGFANNSELEELYLSHNGIEKIDNVFHLTHLTVLDLGANRIASIPQELQALTQLEDFWLNDNKVEHFTDVERLVPLENLGTLYLERNPLASDFEYRKKLEAMLPNLEQIDAVPTTKARRR